MSVLGEFLLSKHGKIKTSPPRILKLFGTFHGMHMRQWFIMLQSRSLHSPQSIHILNPKFLLKYSYPPKSLLCYNG